MTTASDLPPERIQTLNTQPLRPGRFVLYWMQQSQRASANHALEYAVEQANALGQGVRVVFGLTTAFPEANLRHLTFMIEGLRETQAALAARGIPMAVFPGDPAAVALEAGARASLIVCDRGYLPVQREWRQALAGAAPCHVVQVESDVIVPVELASRKAEAAARTLRPRIARWRESFLVPLALRELRLSAPPFGTAGLDLANPARVLAKIPPNNGVSPVSTFFRGGASAASQHFAAFLKNGLPRFIELHNQPQLDLSSRMGPYLHFGQVSPLELALAARDATGAPQAARDAFLEQLVVRRELAINFVQYHPYFATTACLPPWARQTLRAHALDPRPRHYTPAQLEAAATQDPYWNAAMTEMKLRGFLHNHLRMYWGKKILEWSPSPECALTTILRLNNRYFLDGRDPNSYAGAAWILGMHDRAWPERPVYGKVRSMVAAGLERKCDIRAYVARVNEMARQPR